MSVEPRNHFQICRSQLQNTKKPIAKYKKPIVKNIKQLLHILYIEEPCKGASPNCKRYGSILTYETTALRFRDPQYQPQWHYILKWFEGHSIRLKWTTFPTSQQKLKWHYSDIPVLVLLHATCFATKANFGCRSLCKCLPVALPAMSSSSEDQSDCQSFVKSLLAGFDDNDHWNLGRFIHSYGIHGSDVILGFQTSCIRVKLGCTGFSKHNRKNKAVL